MTVIIALGLLVVAVIVFRDVTCGGEATRAAHDAASAAAKVDTARTRGMAGPAVGVPVPWTFDSASLSGRGR